MNYGKVFEEIAKECNDSRAYIIIGLLQSIRDNRLIDKTVLGQIKKITIKGFWDIFLSSTS